MDFVHLHVHTSIGSMQDAMTNVDELFKRARDLGHKAVAITDHGTLAAVFDAKQAAKKYGVKYIPGCEFYFVDDINDKKSVRRHVVLLAQNETGFKNLLKLNYLGFANNQYVPILRKIFPRIDWKMIEEHNEGIICLTACGSGLIARELFFYNEDGEEDFDSGLENATSVAYKIKSIFGDKLYLELQPHDLIAHKHDRKTNDIICTPSGKAVVRVDQKYINRQMLLLSKDLDIPIVAACDVHYLEKEDAKAHDMLMAINEKKPLSDKNRHRYEIEEFYLKTGEEVFKHFYHLFGDNKVALRLCNNTLEIADRCEDAAKYINTDDIRFPKFNVNIEDDYNEFLDWFKKQKYYGKISEDKAYMRFKCINEFKHRFRNFSPEKKTKYKKRMLYEVGVLEEKNFSSYMLITCDLIKKARQQGIRIGPGRGSIGGSLVAYLLDIHEADPFDYGLIFERFYNKLKEAFPDIDTDIDPTGRDWIEKYIIKRYGKECVAHVSNLSKITPKVVIKDIARSLEVGGDKSTAFKLANSITSSIDEKAKTMDQALKQSESLRKLCAEYPEVEKYGRKLIGLEKTFATHAAGLIVSDIDLSTYVPLRVDKDGSISVQYEKERCEAVGLIKMDLLGLEHLSILDSTIKNVHTLGIECPEPHELKPFDDKNVWDMISRGYTECVFQVSSAHMRTLCKQIRPRNIEELALVNALGRPSAKKSRSSYIAIRNKREKITFKHDCLKAPLAETLGVCVYEDQLSKLAGYVAGWDLNKADGLRKLTKLKGKNPELVAQLRKDFIEDSMKYSNITEEIAIDIWDDIIDPFGGYGFNKPHGVFYGINGYYTAYYKYHYPASFMASALRSEEDKAKIRAYKKEAKRLGIKIVVPDVNKSLDSFSVIDEKTISMGFLSINGVGITAVSNILEVREQHPFKSFEDFLYRTSSHKVKKGTIQAMAKAGCFDSLGISRKDAFNLYASIRTKANKHASKKVGSCIGVWDLLNDFSYDAVGVEGEWSTKEKIIGEKEALNDCISGSIIDIYDCLVGDGFPLRKLKSLTNNTQVKVEGVIESIKLAKTIKGKTYAKCVVSDKDNDSSKLTVWPDKLRNIVTQIKENNPIRAICKVNDWNDEKSLVFVRYIS